MKIVITDRNKLTQKIINNENQIINFEYNEYLDFLSFEYKDNKAILHKNDSYYEIISENSTGVLEEYSRLTLKSKIDNTIYDVYTFPEYDIDYKKALIKTDEIIIGSNNLNISNVLISNIIKSFDKISIKLKDTEMILENNNSQNLYINNRINNNTSISIKQGDILFIEGISITIISKYLYIYNSNNNILLDKNSFKEELIENINIDKYEDIKYVNSNKINSINIIPAIKKKIVRKSFEIDPPSAVELKEGNPLFLTMLPMVLMSSTSIIMSFNILNNIKQGKTSWKENSISLIFSGIMIFTMILYPIIQNIYKKQRESKREIKRIEEYKDYIYEKRLKIKEEIEEQKNILLNNFKDTQTCYELIKNNIDEIWDKSIGDNDFLNISLGKGRIKPDIKINYPEEHFTIDRDKLRIQIQKLKEQVEYIEECPIVLNLSKNNNISFISKKETLYNYLKSFLVRLFSSHSYNDVKICVFSNVENKFFWEQYSNLPYFWDDDYSLRFFGYDTSSVSNIVNFLDNIYKERTIKLADKELDKNDTNFIIIIDNYKSINEIVFLNEVMSLEKNYGFNVIFLAENMNNLPSYCKGFVKFNKNEGKLIIKDNNYNEISFIPDIYEADYTCIYEKLSAIYADSNSHKILPDKITFLQMFKVDGIENLNIIDNWNNNTTLDNMGVPIGVNEYGDLIKLDLHENAHGPHGLIAGMTGSGKSELIISLILSLSINYSPKDVQFVLIDYKGGGLSNTFYNNEIGKRLPHIVGVITNISESEINRCLIALQSEIKRRQVLFSEVAIKYNEGNIDIYKYQQIAKKHKETEYLSHLVIISDEFAELKTQNPEFIEKLVSLARIGRSLGIHLILCTQKPSGVVDSQIWSNSKFKICLKVQDKSDSREIIGIDDAVYLNVPGRFFLQIGYNELFIKGQCAYSNAPFYVEETSSKISKYKLDFINDCGKVYYSYSPLNPDKTLVSGTHVSNVVKHLINKAVEQNYDFNYLWKESLKDKIIFDELIEKYKYQKKSHVEIVFGEYDEIDNQRKDLASLNLSNGNIILYGLTGSGKTELIQTSLYFLLKYYNVNDINIYLMDFSLENLKCFSNAPQVGDVMYLYEKEKILNTFKYINTILSERKELLSNYNGNIEKYNQENKNKLPIIFLIINNLERLFENFNELENIFLDITRDCNKFGITLLVTVNNQSSVRSKLIQGFKQIITLELKDKYDYDSIFGTKINYTLPHIFGRGFIKKNKVYEMQIACILKEEDNLYEYIENTCNKLISESKAPSIPILPDRVSFDIIKPHLNNNLFIPTGIDVDTLEILKLDMTKKDGIIFTSNDSEILENYINCFIKNLSIFNKNKVFIFSDEFNLDINNVTLITNNYGKYFKQLIDFIEKADKNVEYFIIFKSLNEIIESLTNNIQEKALLYEIIEKINKFEQFHLILFDLISSIKRYEYSEFFVNNFNKNRGIFIGEGISDQYIIKINNIPRKYRELPSDNYGYYVENNKVKCMKVLEYKDE